jgi:CRISPR-associated protein Cas2
MDYIVAYDITDPKRLTRLHRYLRTIAIAIQYSIFYLKCDERQLERLLKPADDIIDSRVDDFRCYPLPERGLKIRLGRATLPDGVYFTALPPQWTPT